MPQMNANTITPAYVHKLVDELCQGHWYGTIEVKLEAGNIVLMRKTETIKQQPPSDLKRGLDVTPSLSR